MITGSLQRHSFTDSIVHCTMYGHRGDSRGQSLSLILRPATITESVVVAEAA
jgi:hypothetical protein